MRNIYSCAEGVLGFTFTYISESIPSVRQRGIYCTDKLPGVVTSFTLPHVCIRCLMLKAALKDVSYVDGGINCMLSQR